MENKEEPVFFWKATGPFACFSQWYPCLLTGPRKEQCTSAEQFMMLSKADCFGDEETYKEILAATTKAEIRTDLIQRGIDTSHFQYTGVFPAARDWLRTDSLTVAAR